MDNSDFAALAQGAATSSSTALATCYAAACRWNRNGACALNGIEIGAAGGCLHFEEQTEEQLRRYLAGRGLSAAAIDEILQEAAKHGDN